MIKINPDPQFTADVEITVPGQEETAFLPLTFRYKSRVQYVEWLETLDEKQDDAGNITSPGKDIYDAFRDFVASWGLDEEFSGENIKTFLDNYPAAYREILRKYSELLFASRVKN